MSFFYQFIMQSMKKTILTSMVIWLSILPISSFAQQTTNDFEIIPEATSQSQVDTSVKSVWASWGDVRKNYNEQAQKMNKNVWNQIASGIMTRDTLLDYIVYLVKFLSQIGIVIWVIMIIYAGYLFASSIFDASNMSKGKEAIKNAIIGVLVIAFSYAIMKALTSAFLS